MSAGLGPGFHAPAGGSVDIDGYEGWVGRWSRLFVPSVLAAADVSAGDVSLDVSTGTGEAAAAAVGMVGPTGRVVGVDIAPAMAAAARTRLRAPTFLPVAGDGMALPFGAGRFDSLVCQLGLQFFPDPSRGLGEFRRVLRPAALAGVCVISTPDKAPMWGIVSDELSRVMPAQRHVLQLSFALSDPARLAAMFQDAGFIRVDVQRVTKEDAVTDFDSYWRALEHGTGAIPQIYRMLDESARRSIRQRTLSRLSEFRHGNTLAMSVETLIGTGRA
jgi:ubiquinone/menaquinone biosynthesis C-methylase UbiE